MRRARRDARRAEGDRGASRWPAPAPASAGARGARESRGHRGDDRRGRAASATSRAPITTSSIEKHAGNRDRGLPLTRAGRGRPRFRAHVAGGRRDTPQAAMFTQHGSDTDYALLMVVPPEPTADEAKRAQAHAARDDPHRRHVGLDGGRVDGSRRRTRSRMALDTLTERDRFNVIEFNSVTRAALRRQRAGDARRIGAGEGMGARAQGAAAARRWRRALDLRARTARDTRRLPAPGRSS